MSQDISLPNPSFAAEVAPGAIKKIKTDNRRCDAMSFVDPRKLVVIPGFNVRVQDEAHKAHVRGLADSMLEEGFLINKPITCYVRKGQGGEDEICVTDGHCRHEAALLAIQDGAQIETVPVVFLGKAVNMADLTVDLVRANNGKPLSTYETSIVVKRLSNMDFSEAEIARKLGFTRTHIDNLLVLASAPNPLARLVIAGEVSASTAIEAMRKHGPERAVEVLRKAVEGAKANGKTRVTASQLPGAAFARAVKKSAPQFVTRARAIRLDPGFQHLTAENRAALEQLLDGLPPEQGVPDAEPERAAA